MKKNKRIIIVLLVIAALAVFAGCPQEEENGAEPAPNGNDNGEENEGEVMSLENTSLLVEQWDQSGHARLDEELATRENCLSCHSGLGFARETGNPDEVPYAAPVDCRACHTGQGQSLLEEQEVAIPTAESVEGGTATQCFACHNARREPNIEDPDMSAPHYSSQAEVFTGTGGMEVEEVDYQNSPHTGIENSCNTCHSTTYETGFSDHTFAMENQDIGEACGDCHGGIEDYNMPVDSNYDGVEETEGFQDQVQELLNILEAAIYEELDGGSFSTSRGNIVFEDGEGEEIEDISPELYRAAYNWLLVSQDGSLGLHNPDFAVQLLQTSYEDLTGEEIPGADIIE